ncbi:hypothetical protein GW17_00056929 [Ensete ventricosum]|nr:hypothetical protein GW17_00056929 [Ensete ventricosum]
MFFSCHARLLQLLVGWRKLCLNWINQRSRQVKSSCKLKCDKVLPLEENRILEELRENDAEFLDNHYHDCGLDEFEKYGSLLSALHEAESAQKQFRIVEQIKNLLKEDDEARIFMGTNGAVEVLAYTVFEDGCPHW